MSADWGAKMKKLVVAILISTLAPSPWATTYYLATAAGGGSDSNKGTSAGAPWLTPNHSVNCGDVIIAAASSAYVATNFQWTKWGTVMCPAGNNVAWLKCVTFDACKINDTSGMVVDKSYWGIQGWEVTDITDSGRGNGCFTAAPYYAAPVQVHHIIFANNVVNICSGGGGILIGNGGSSTVGADYIAIIGNIVYNGANGRYGGGCYSGIDFYAPRQSDSLPGTHDYASGNFSWGNVDANPCDGGLPSDGEGLLIDTPNGSVGRVAPYTAQIVIDNNMFIANGGRGLQVYQNNASPMNALIYFRHNTIWGNDLDVHSNQGGIDCSELLIQKSSTTQAFFNIAATSAATGCAGSVPIYAFSVDTGGPTNQVYSNVGWSAGGYHVGSAKSAGFSYGPNNLFGTNPSFANAVAPGAPSCGSATSVPDCMATVIANFTPTNASAVAYGYQKPSTTQTYDTLFPQWLCNVNLPADLVTMGCVAQSSRPMPPTMPNVTVQ